MSKVLQVINSKKNFGLRERMILQVGIFVALTFAVIMLATSFMARSNQVTATKANMHDIASGVSQDIHTNIQLATGLAQTMADYQMAGGFGDRQTSEKLVRSILESNDYITGAFIGYEPNADNGDARHAGSSAGHDAAGRFLPYWFRDNGQLALEPLLDMESSDYYMGAKTSRALYMTEPYLYEGVMLFSVSAPIIQSNQFVGVAGVDISLADVSAFLAAYRPYETAQFYLLSEKDLFIAAPDAAMVGQPLSQYTDFADAFSQVRNSDEEAVAVTRGGAKFMYSQIRLPKGGWSLLLEVRESEIMQPITRMNFINTGMAFLGIAVILALIFFIITRAINPVKRLTEVAERVAEGDFTIEVAIAQNDEIGQLADVFNRMNKSLRELMSQAVDTATGVTQSAAGLLSSVESTSASISQVAASSGEFASNTQNLSTSAQDMASLAHTISQSAQEGQSEITGTIEEMRMINTIVENLNASIEKLSNRSAEIGNIVGIITQVAGQTNLLALNAAIEAARAGEHGRGFAVVAEEVRKLAEQAGRAAEDIGRLIEATQKDTNETHESMEKALAGVRKGSDAVSQSGTTFMRILEHVSQIVSQVDSISAAAQELSAGSEEVAASTEEQSAAMEEINATAEQLQQSAHDLFSALEKFKYK